MAGLAGSPLGKRVIIAGAGPLGLPNALAAQQAEAAEIAIFGIASKPLAVAEAIGVDRTLKLGEDGDSLKPFQADKGFFDVAFEATGAAATLAARPGLTRTGGTIVQIAMLQLSEVGLTVNLMMSKEIDMTQLITDSYGIEDAAAAFATAADRERSIKVQLPL